MAGTVEGGKLAAKTNKEIHGEDFYVRIGALGGKKGRTGGFYHPVDCDCSVIPGDHYVRQCAGAKGGLISRRRRATA